MTLHGFLILVILFAVLGVAIGFICNTGKGWHGGCTGHCATCQEHCSDEKKKPNGSAQQ